MSVPVAPIDAARLRVAVLVEIARVVALRDTIRDRARRTSRGGDVSGVRRQMSLMDMAIDEAKFVLEFPDISAWGDSLRRLKMFEDDET